VIEHGDYAAMATIIPAPPLATRPARQGPPARQRASKVEQLDGNGIDCAGAKPGRETRVAAGADTRAPQFLDLAEGRPARRVRGFNPTSLVAGCLARHHPGQLPGAPQNIGKMPATVESAHDGYEVEHIAGSLAAETVGDDRPVIYQSDRAARRALGVPGAANEYAAALDLETVIQSELVADPEWVCQRAPNLEGPFGPDHASPRRIAI
jgi:hypothetical protein